MGRAGVKLLSLVTPRADMDELWQQLQATDSNLDGTEKEATGQRSRLNKLSRELGELNRTVSYLSRQMGKMTNASFNGKRDRNCIRTKRRGPEPKNSLFLETCLVSLCRQSLSVASRSPSSCQSKPSGEPMPPFKDPEARWATPNAHARPPLTC